MQQLESVIGGRLVVRVVRYHGAHLVGGKDLGRQEMPGREGAFAEPLGPMSITSASAGMANLMPRSLPIG